MTESRVLELIIRAKDQTSKAFNNIGKNTTGLTERIRRVGLAMLALGTTISTALITSLNKAAGTAIDYGRSVISIRRLTGATAEESSKLAAIFYRLGIEGKQVGMIFRALSAQITSNTSILNKYGIATREADGSHRELIPVLMDLADKYASMEDKAAANVLAAKALGRGYMALLPVLSAGRKGISELIQKAEEYGFVLTDQNINVIRKYISAQKDLEMANTGLKVSFGLLVIPLKTEVNKWLTRVVGWFAKLPKETRESILAFTSLGTAFQFVAGAIALLSTIGWKYSVVALLLAKIAFLVYLQWNNLKKLFEKYKPTLKAFADAIVRTWIAIKPFFIWVGNVVAKSLRVALDNLRKAWNNLEPSIKRLLPYLKIFGIVLVSTVVVAIGLVITSIALLIVAFAKLIQGISWIIKVISQFASTWRNVWESAKLTAFDALSSIIKQFADLPGRIISPLSYFSTILNSGFTGAKNRAIGTVSSLVNAVSFLIGRLPSLTYSVGVNLVKSLWSGISSQFAWLKKKVEEWANNILRWIRRILKIESPSKVFEELGVLSAQGFAAGLTKQIKIEPFINLATPATAAPVHYHYDKIQVILPNVTRGDQFIEELQHDLRNRR